MGEAKFAQSASGQACEEAIESCSPALDQGIRVQTPGGIFDVQWSNEGKATAMGQLCSLRLNIEPPCRSNIEPGRVAEFGVSNCG